MATTLVTGNANATVGTAVHMIGRKGIKIQATVVGTGAVTAVVKIEGNVDNRANWVTLGTITLNGTTSATDGFASAIVWDYTRATIVTISGTGAVATAVSSDE